MPNELNINTDDLVNETLFRYFAESALSIPWIYNNSLHQFSYIGPQIEIFSAYTVAEWRKQNFLLKHVHLSDSERTIEFFNTPPADSTPTQLEFRLHRPDGTTIWLFASRNRNEPLPEQMLLCGSIINITQYKHDLELLAYNKANFEAMFNSITDTVIFTDTNNCIVMANGSMNKLFGYTEAELLGRTTEFLYADASEYQKQQRKRYNVNAKRYRTTYEMDYKRKDGSCFPSETLGTKVKNSEGNVIGFISMIRDITERKLAETKLMESEKELSAILDSIQDTYYQTNSKGMLTRVSPSVERLLGYKPQELIGSNLASLYFDPALREAFLLELANNNGIVQNRETQLRHKNGSPIWVSTNAHYRLNQSGYMTGVEGIARDITQLKYAEDLRNRLGRILDNSSNEIFIIDAKSLRFIQVNRGALQNLGYTAQEMEAMTPIDITPEFTQESFKTLVEPLYQDEKEEIVFKAHHLRKQGTLYPVEVCLQLSLQDTPPVFVAFIQDITERIQAERKLQHMAHHDSLTTLPNRILFAQNLEQSLARSNRHNMAVAVMFLDLDRFKIINDTLGHDIGDKALQALSGRLNSCVKQGDSVARLGGDEFAIVLENISSPDDVAPTARKILELLSRPFLIDGHELFITTSIGISLYPADGTDTQTLLKHADIAMYRAKDQGRNTYRYYSSDMGAMAVEQLGLETSLRYALERNEFVLYYQPQYRLSDCQLIGYEALLRWQHPERGIIMPKEFIPILEETGLIIPVSEWVLQVACKQASRWNKNRNSPLRVSVNLSIRQTNDINFVPTVMRILKNCNLSPNLLELEITESILMHNIQATVTTLESLNRHGIRLAIDDFGTGYSSLNYLKRFPIVTMKIDQTFIRDLTQSPDDATLVKAIIAMGRTLRLNVVAEGVETHEQFAFLSASNCNAIQGYLASQPVPASQLDSCITSLDSIMMAP